MVSLYPVFSVILKISNRNTIQILPDIPSVMLNVKYLNARNITQIAFWRNVTQYLMQ